MRTLLTVFLALWLVVPVHAAKTYTITQLIDRARMSLVKISYPVIEEGVEGTRFCAGFVVDAARGWVLTAGAGHCVPEEKNAPVYFDDNLDEPHPVLYATELFALVKDIPMRRPPLDLRKDEPSHGELVVSVGYGFSHFTTFVRHVGAVDQGDVLLDGTLIPGMSGGPTLDEQGRVVGINQYTMPESGASVVCGAEEIRAFLKHAMK